MKDGSLLIYSLESFYRFTYRTLFQNGANDMSKMVYMVNNFLSKTSDFFVVRIIRFCSNFTRLWYKHVLRNYKKYLKLLMLATATETYKSLNVKFNVKSCCSDRV